MTTETFPIPEQEEPIPKAEMEAAEKEAVMDRFKGERAGILSKVFNRKVGEAALLLTPGVDVVALAAFAARGETLTGKELDGRERVATAAIAGFLGLFYALQLSGMQKEALAARGMAATLGAIEFGPQLIEKARSLAAERLPSIVPFLEKTAAFVSGKANLAKDIQQSMINFASDNPDLTALNLNG
jgi:hypothetical protein